MSAEIDTLKQQVVELQSQLAFQEDALSSLDAALALQQQEMLLLRRQLELLRARQKEYESHNTTGTESEPLDEKPPHY